MMGFLKRLPELVCDSRGRLSSTRLTTLAALLVSSVVVAMCGYWNRQPVDALAVYLSAWVTHAGVQRYHENRAGGVREGKDEHGTD